MKRACFIPIKRYSERVKGKNFKMLAGKPLYQHIIENCIEADCFDDIYVDTDSEEITNFAHQAGIKTIPRLAWLSSDKANGNDLLVHHFKLQPDYDYYFQAFATAPFLSSQTISNCVHRLVHCDCEYDSIFTILEKKGFFWFENQPLNYQPSLLPRSQDLPSLIEETTGLYGITRQALDKYRSRIGANAFQYPVEPREAIDLNTEDDFNFAEWLYERKIKS